eukprot:SAG25_NODE_2943_length_1305_cov_0.807629_2_plen_128_part_00
MTWDEKTKTVLDTVLTANVLPLARDLRQVARDVFNRCYPLVLDTSLPLRSQPRDYCRLPAFARDLRQLRRFDKFVLHLENSNRKREFVGAGNGNDHVTGDVNALGMDVVCQAYNDDPRLKWANIVNV